jgi:orotate phosphoribosyltransferase
MGNQIEGAFEKGQKVVVIEDLISTGGSSIKAIQALKEAELDVKGLIAIFTYGFKVADENFKNENCPYVTLTNYDFMVEEALSKDYITDSDVISLRKWKDSPETWNK